MVETTNDKAAKLVAEYFETALEKKPKWKPDASLLLHPNIPKPLHGVNPRSLMKSKKWDRTRKFVYASSNYRCFACGIQAYWDEDRDKFGFSDAFNSLLKLHAHEDYTIDYYNKTVTINKIISLCPTCHNYVHSGRTQSLYDKGVFDEEDMWYIFTNGNTILKENNIDFHNRNIDSNTYEEEWGKWSLIYNGKSYKSNFKSYIEWKEHYEKV